MNIEKTNVLLEHLINFEEKFKKVPKTEKLDYCLKELQSMNYDYLKQGKILWEFRKNSKWKELGEYRDFEDFCFNYLHEDESQVINKMNAFSLATQLMNLGFTELPRSLNVAIVLEILKKEGTNTDSYEERLKKVWTQVLKLPKIKISTTKVKEIIKSTYPDLFGDKKKKSRGFAS
jgi:hypothetical protein